MRTLSELPRFRLAHATVAPGWQAAQARSTLATAAAARAAAEAKLAQAASGSAKVAAALKAANPEAVSAVFTLGSPVNWGLAGLMMGDPVSNIYNLFGSAASLKCVGYSALTVKIGSSTTAFYAANGVIYGFALTAPSQPACQ